MKEFQRADEIDSELIIETVTTPEEMAVNIINENGMDYALAVAEKIIFKARISI